MFYTKLRRESFSGCGDGGSAEVTSGERALSGHADEAGWRHSALRRYRMQCRIAGVAYGLEQAFEVVNSLPANKAVSPQNLGWYRVVCYGEADNRT